MRRKALITFLFAAGIGFSDQRVQLTWRGEVNGPARLYIQGERVDVDRTGNNVVNNPTYEFQSALPSQPVTLDVNVRQGRGQVRVVQQPAARNKYTAIVNVTPQGRQDYFDLEFLWDDRYATGSVYGSNDRYSDRDDGYSDRDDRYSDRNDRRQGQAGRRAQAADSGTITWTGTVDNEAIVQFRGNRADVTTVRGQRASTENLSRTARMPRTGVNVNILDSQGRGRVELVEQPSSQNNYTARVRIRDEEDGAGRYTVVLGWGDSYGYQSDSGYGTRSRTDDQVFGSSGGSDVFSGAYSGGNRFVWSGRVDGKVRVHVQGGRYWAETISGRPAENVRADMGAPLPRSNISLDLKRLNGRDDVRLVQKPASSNGYEAIFEIDDNDGGADDYEVELKW